MARKIIRSMVGTKINMNKIPGGTVSVLINEKIRIDSLIHI